MSVMERNPEAVHAFVERFASALVDSGMPRTPSRIFAVLLATDSGRLTATELAERLQVSPGAISGAVRYLLQLNLIAREHEPRSRRDHYRVYDDIWYELYRQQEPLYARFTQSAREGVDALGPETDAGRRLAETVAYFEFILAEMPALHERWRERRATLRAQEP